MKYLFEAVLLLLEYVMCNGKFSTEDYIRCESLHSRIENRYNSIVFDEDKE